MSAEQYRNELENLHASPELKARLAALQSETPTATKPPRLRVAKRAGASFAATAACLMLCMAVWRGGLLAGKTGFSSAAPADGAEVTEYSVQMNETALADETQERETAAAPQKRAEQAAAGEAGDWTAGAEAPSAAGESSAAARSLPEDAMLRVDGTLYRYSGQQSDALRCGMMDGAITAVTGSGETPTEDDQANFGAAGMGYQYGRDEGTVEVYLAEADAWFVFEAVDEAAAQP